jgi:hypothetical protein
MTCSQEKSRAAMSESENRLGHGEQETYWNQLVLLKIVSCYVRRYRDRQSRWINLIGFFKAAVTSSTIAAWVIWKEYAIVWGVLIGISQVVDAGKEYLPQIKSRRQASEFVSSIENIIIDARFEWYEIFVGKCDPDDIMDRWRKLARILNETETKYFPDGLPANEHRQRLAESDARAYFLSTYGVEGKENG